MLLSMALNPVTPTSDAGWSGTPSVSVTNSGAVVTPESAMRTSAVFAAVSLIAKTIGSLPIGVYQKLPAGGRKPVASHNVSSILHRSPNSWQTPMEYIEMEMASLTLRGNFYSYKAISSSGLIEELVPIHPNRVKPFWKDNRMLYEVTSGDSPFTKEIYTSDEIHHVRGLSLDGVSGLSVIEQQRETIGMALASQEYGARFFANDATPRGILQYPGKFKDLEGQRRFSSSWKEAQAGVNRHSTAILEDGMTYKEVGMTNEDAQFLETRKFSITDIARIFGVPPHMIADLERATFSNITDQSIEFVVYCISPWVVRLEQAIKRDLIVEDDIYVKFNVDGLLRGDPASRSAYYASGITQGYLTRNEVREKEDMNPLDGLDEPLSQVNMTQQTKPVPTKEDEASTDARLAALEASGIDRVIRKEAKILKAGIYSMEEFMNAAGNHSFFIENVLAVDNSIAQQAVNLMQTLYDNKVLIEDFPDIRHAQLTKLLSTLKGGTNV